jgi:hypothetical protein
MGLQPYIQLILRGLKENGDTPNSLFQTSALPSLPGHPGAPRQIRRALSGAGTDGTA